MLCDFLISESAVQLKTLFLKVCVFQELFINWDFHTEQSRTDSEWCEKEKHPENTTPDR